MEPSPIPIEEERPLAPLTTWQIGGPADLFAEPSSAPELAYCLGAARDAGVPVLPLGGGSNVLIADKGYRGMVLRYADASVDLSADGDRATVRIGAGALLAPTARRLCREGWSGLEWAEGIPGTFGGATAGNAGAFGGDIAGITEGVFVFSAQDGATFLDAEACGFAYRTSAFRGRPSAFILQTVVRLTRGEPALLTERCRQIAAERRARTPAGLSCGSVFKNPPGDAAGRLIERAGLKGATEGAAQISPVHANYIVNRGGAKAADVLSLIERARSAVRRESGVELELEIRLVGFEP